MGEITQEEWKEGKKAKDWVQGTSSFRQKMKTQQNSRVEGRAGGGGKPDDLGHMNPRGRVIQERNGQLCCEFRVT